MVTSSTVQQARQQIAGRLREIRLDGGLTKRAVAAAAGWHESKCSRIEHARTPPSDADIRAWCRICGADDQAADLIAASRAADSTWTQWRKLERPGLRRVQESVIPLWESTREFRIYSPFLVPGPVQTAAYIRALLKAVRRSGLVPPGIPARRTYRSIPCWSWPRTPYRRPSRAFPRPSAAALPPKSAE